VAIKTFKNVYVNDPQGLTAHGAWNTEAKNLRELNERNHPHLIRRVATVVLGKQYIILSDWANGGDLKSFWEKAGRPYVKPKLVLEVVTQLRGLASAIELMHYGNDTGTPSRSVSQSSSTHTLSTPVVIEVDGKPVPAANTDTAVGDSNWRHGDLKPENILRFVKHGELVGTLCISDLGLAKRHVESTVLRKLPSTSHFGTLNYEPPETMIRRLSPRSRLYDIWSFGCIMLEFVVWLLYGHEGLVEFWKLPIEKDGTLGTLFWTTIPGGKEPGAKVNPSVAQVMDGILASPACRLPSAIGDLLLLVKGRVLVPALPGVHNTILPENQRIQANVLLKALENIEERCNDPQYCCPGQPERGARLPTNVLQPISRNISDTLHIPATQHGNGPASLQVPSNHQVPSSLQVPSSRQVPSGAARAPRVMPIR
jgi:serine/threonine protein kinase